MGIDEKKLRKATVKVMSWVAKKGKLHDYTRRMIRQKVEEEMSLEPDALNTPEHKAVVNKQVEDYLEKHEPSEEDDGSEAEEVQQEEETKAVTVREAKSSKASKPRSSKTAPAQAASKNKEIDVRSPSTVPSSDEEAGPTPKPRALGGPGAKRVDSESEVSETTNAAKSSGRREKASTSRQVDRDMDVDLEPEASTSFPSAGARKSVSSAPKEDDEKSESEMSVLEDEPAPRNRKKRGDSGAAASRPEKATKGRKRKEPAKELSKDEETIKKLKSLVVACGVRKVWHKEFRGMDRPSDQIRHLRTILSDLGMKGRMSLERAKSIKAKREFQKELEDVQEFAQKMESANSRREKMRRTSSAAEDLPEDLDVGVVPKRRKTARESIMAFLGDEDESD